jgi:hypothetical protein
VLTTGPAGATHCSEETFSRPLFNLGQAGGRQGLPTAQSPQATADPAGGAAGQERHQPHP